MPSVARYRSDVRTVVGLMTGAIKRRTTATGGSTTAITDTKAISAATTYLQGHEVILRPGTTTQEQRTLPVFVPGSDQWSVIAPAFTNAAANADVYEIWDESILSIAQANQIVDQAIGAVFTQSSLPVYNDELTVNDILFGDGQFEVAFVSGAARGAATTGAGTATRVTADGTYTRGVAGMRLVNTASNAFAMVWTIGNFEQYAGKSITIKSKCRITSAVTDRVRLQVSDGITTTSSLYYYDGVASVANVWKELSKDVTINANPSTLTFSARIETGTAITAEFDDFRVILTDKVREYPIRLPMDNLRAVYQAASDDTFKSSTFADYGEGVQVSGLVHGWRVERGGATPTLWIPNDVGLVADRRLRLEGGEQPAYWTDDTTTVTMTNEQYEAVKANAIYLGILASQWGTAAQTEARVTMWQEEARLKTERASRTRSNERKLR